MDRRVDWPWSWEEEAEWKAELEERDYDFVAELIDDAVEDEVGASRYAPEPRPEKTAEDAPEKYLVAA